MFLVTLDTWPGNGGRRPKGQERVQVSSRFASLEGVGQFLWLRIGYLNVFKIFLDKNRRSSEDLNMFNMSTLTDKGELTRNTILATALQFFRDRGFEATTMRDIANQAGVSLRAAYYYFDSKDNI